MNVFRDVFTPAVSGSTKSTCVYAVCDVCGIQRTRYAPTDYSGDCDWADKEGSILETNISLSTGYHDRDGGDRTVMSVHVCPKCFMDYLVPYLAEFRKEDDKSMFPHVSRVDY